MCLVQYVFFFFNYRAPPEINTEPLAGSLSCLKEPPLEPPPGVDHGGWTDSWNRRGRRPTGRRHHADARIVSGPDSGDRSGAHAPVGCEQGAVEIAGDQPHTWSPTLQFVWIAGHVGRTLPTRLRSSQAPAQPNGSQSERCEGRLSRVVMTGVDRDSG